MTKRTTSKKRVIKAVSNDTAEGQATLKDFISREVYYCVSSLIHDMGQKPEYMDELMPVLQPDDYENAAIDGGWAGPHTDEYGATYYKNKTDGQTWTCGSWQELCEAHNIEPYQTEVYEHWLVSGYLADKLEAHGEPILRDFHGLTIWGRTTTGQAIAMDGVIECIYNEMMEA